MTLKEVISYKVQLGEEDCSAFVELDPLRYWRALAFVCTPVFFLCYIPGNSFKDVCGAVGIIGLMCIGWRFLYLKQHILGLLKTPMYSSEQTYSLSESELSFTNGQFDFRSNWNQFVKWSDTKTALCVFSSATQFYLLPNRCFSDSQLAEVKEHLAATLGPSYKPKIGVIVLALFGLLAIFAVAGAGLWIIATKFGTIKLP